MLGSCLKTKSFFSQYTLFKPVYCSDLRVLLEGGHQVHAHKFVLQARSEDWAATCDLGHASELDMSGEILSLFISFP